MKLSLNALKERAEAKASEELLSTITGGLQDHCHVTTQQNPDGTIDIHIYNR